jgi:hypothetical protein
MEPDSTVLLEEGWPGVEGLLGGGEAIDALAVASGAIRRRRGVQDGSQLLRLALIYATSQSSLRTTAAWAASAMDMTLSDVALLGRFREAGRFLELVVARLLARTAESGPEADWTGSPIRIVDSSIFSGPRGASQQRLHASYDPAAGCFDRLELTDARGGEALRRAHASRGMIVVGDRNYAKTGEARALSQKGAFFVVRAGLQSMQMISAATNKRLNTQDIFAALGDAPAAEIDALLKDAKPRRGEPHDPLPVRVVLLRATERQAAREKARIDRSRTKEGVTPMAQTYAMADVVLLVTNLDAAQWPPTRLAQLYRLRWQIELAFKTLKSNFRMRHPPAKDPRLIRTWILANLASALLAEVLARDIQGSLPPSASL